MWDVRAVDHYSLTTSVFVTFFSPRSAYCGVRIGRVEPVGSLYEEEQNMWIQERLAVSGSCAPSAGPQPRHLPGLYTLTGLRSADREKEVRRGQDALCER